MFQSHWIDRIGTAGPRARLCTPAYGRRLAAREGCGLVLDVVARHRKVPVHMLLHGSRCRAPVALARQIAMYLMHVELGLSMADVARAFARDRTTVAHACARIEDRRDDPAFDLDIEALEVVIEARMQAREANHGAR